MIEAKTLRIGSHVSMNGVRARVVRLTTVDYGHGDRWHILVRGVSPDDGIEREVGSFVDDNAVQPISITPALLEGLGFKYKRPVLLWIKASENEYLSFEQICGTNRYRVHLYSGGIDRGKCACRYLHEAEAFLALHGVELIPD